jgi:pyridinium-3,5-biscarboxylic acid mononucleotide sulfurtransferase
MSSLSSLITPDAQEKLLVLKSYLRSAGRMLIAYSGGVDSAFLAWVASRELGADMLAVLADSPSLARSQMRDAVAFAEEQHIPLKIVATQEMQRIEYRQNNPDRCFHCKDELFNVMAEYCRQNGFDAVAYGVNVDDQGDYRPGQEAAREHGVLVPLLEAKLTKDDIRQLAREAGLRVWDKPASACLSSRIEYGRPVTSEALSAIEQGEDALREMGFRQVRVRHHGEIVRIEIAREELARALTLEMAREFTRLFKSLGFSYVTLDLEGFRSGSMNALLPLESLRKA